MIRTLPATYARAAIAVGELLLLCGCSAESMGPPTVHLAGAVTIDGQPLPADAEASIMFKPTQRGQAKSVSVVITGGRYDAPGVPRGEVRAYLNIQRPTGRMISEAGGSPYPEFLPMIASEYGSGILLGASEDNLQQDFDLRAVAD